MILTMKMSRKKALLGISFILIFLFSFSNGLHTKIYGSENNAILSLIIASAIVWYGVGHKLKRFTLHDLWIVVLIFILVFNNQDDKTYGTLTQSTLILILIWFIYLIIKDDNSWHEIECNIFLAFGIFHATMTWITFFTPEFYIGTIAPLFGNNAGQVISQYSKGWMPGLTPHYSTNGIYLGMTAVTAVAYLINFKKYRGKYLFYTLLIVSALLLTGKRSQTIALILASLIMYYLFCSNRKTTRVFKLVAIFVVTIAVFYIAAQYVPQLANIVSRFEASIENGDITYGRSARFLATWQLFLEKPMFGIGWNGTIYYFKQLEGLVINTHNIYLQLLAETGIFGSMIYFGFIIYNLYWGIKLLIAHRKGSFVPEITSVGFFLCNSVGTQIWIIFYGMTGNPLYDYQSLYPYIVMCAVTFYYKKRYMSNR